MHLHRFHPKKIVAFCLHIIKTKPGACILGLLLGIISLGILKPEFYLMGWDNFSSYLNLKSSLFNTLFATWREHRGLGVPSDAEVNDLFRQLFSLFVSRFVPREIVDQLYVVCMLWGGVFGMYTLGRYISKIKLKQHVVFQELFGFLAGFFYLFNLSTLAVFYFPMIMYITRFFMLPTATYVIFRIAEEKQISIRTYLWYSLLLFIGFGSAMVPTIFVVLCISLGILFLVVKEKRRMFGSLAFFILLGSYWILPFANYTIQKSKIVPLAPTFVEINESMLNKPKSYYSFEHQAKMNPSFFESQFLNNASGKKMFFHPLADQAETGITRTVLWIFPFFYLGGIVYIFLVKRHWSLFYFAVMTIVFVLLSMKEYSPVGTLYSFISTYIPFTNTIFRFGDTKFHAMIAFGGSICAAVGLVALIEFIYSSIKTFVIRIILTMGIGCLLLFHIFPFFSYLNGNFIGFFMYNKIPNAYFDMAQIINDDTSPVRVIQLPLDSHSYWKPYSWGYFGSAFLHFMLNKPIFDRSFEPASVENADVHKRILEIVHSASSIQTEELLADRASQLLHTLQDLSIKYVIDDQTVSTNIDARNITYWGTINATETHRMLQYLHTKEDVEIVKQYTISTSEYAKEYAKLFPYNKPSSYPYPARSITLYQLKQTKPRVQFITSADIVNSKQSLTTTPPLDLPVSPYIQLPDKDGNSVIFPFLQQQNKVELAPGSYVVENTTNVPRPTYLAHIYAERDRNTLTLDLETILAPPIRKANDLQNTVHTYAQFPIGGENIYFARIEETLFSLAPVGREKSQIGTVLLHQNPTKIHIITSQKEIIVPLIQLEPNPQCFQDAQEDPQSAVTGDNGTLVLSGQNVSTCLTTTVPLNNQEGLNQNTKPIFAQLELEAQGAVESIGSSKKIDTGKPNLHTYIASLPNPLSLSICVKTQESDLCLNQTTLFSLNTNVKKIYIPISGNSSGINSFKITLAVKNTQRQKYSATVSNLKLRLFSSDIPEQTIGLPSPVFSLPFSLETKENLSFSLPSTDTNYPNVTLDALQHGLARGDETCMKEERKYQAIKQYSQHQLSYVASCRNYIQTTVPFSSDRFYKWNVEYKHLSGALPSLIVADKLGVHTFEKLTPPDFINANDYFSGPLQQPESLFIPSFNFNSVTNKIPWYLLEGYIYPRFDLLDTKNKDLILQHYSEKEGILEIRSIALQELPNYWPNIQIRPTSYTKSTFDFPNPSQVSYHRILPSLWKVEYSSKKGNYMLLFNEQYDKQWVLFGIQNSVHVRCNGFANCYLFSNQSKETSIYFFYFPELLSFVGWIITCITFVLGLRFFCLRH